MSKNLLIKHFGYVAHNVFTPVDRQKYNNQLAGLDGKKCALMIEEVEDNATVDQHAYYRGAVIKTCLKSEYFAHSSDDDVHELFTTLFLGYVVFINTGGLVWSDQRYYSTAKMKKKPFAEFLEKVIAWCAEHNIIIHSPEDYYLECFKTINK